ncbi:hypothetical protein [Amaricoccus sp.]|uniref:hypothetical protein n=1 Tax=Amaricoccus sp. TaxID=1872485 RepID=UPI002D0BE944|nr:hypothetical protein [Amaricoccus sp.]HMQ94290.1 hypothetical protein [Amaricoccus sp.]HMR53790.1 hypothetical protein [Amaricoccus sp.]HMR61986.1 hypothetical protein [Amaricoccus sp.]
MPQSPFLDFDELFARIGVLGHEFHERLEALDGTTVTMRGYLAPAIPGSREVLVLTRAPAATGSEGGTDQGWPEDAVFVLPSAEGGDFAPGRLTEVEGVLEHGPLRLDAAGASSLVRLRGARWAPA